MKRSRLYLQENKGRKSKRNKKGPKLRVINDTDIILILNEIEIIKQINKHCVGLELREESEIESIYLIEHDWPFCLFCHGAGLIFVCLDLSLHSSLLVLLFAVPKLNLFQVGQSELYSLASMKIKTKISFGGSPKL